MVKITPCQVLTTQQIHKSTKSTNPPNKSTPQNLSLPQIGRSPLYRNTIWKTLNCPFTSNEDFLEKRANISINFVCLLFPIMVKCFSKKILRAKLNSNFSHATKEDILGKLQYIKMCLMKLECLIIKKSLEWILRCWQCKHNYIDTYLHAKAKNFH